MNITVDNGRSWVLFYEEENGELTYSYIRKTSIESLRRVDVERGPNDFVSDLWLKIDGVERKINVHQLTDENASIVVNTILNGLDSSDDLEISIGNLYGYDYDSNYNPE